MQVEAPIPTETPPAMRAKRRREAQAGRTASIAVVADHNPRPRLTSSQPSPSGGLVGKKQKLRTYLEKD